MHKEIENAFETLAKILFGKPMAGIEGYAEWLKSNVRLPTKVKSAVSDKSVYPSYFLFFQLTKNRMVTMEEAMKIGKKSISKDEVSALSMENAQKLLKNIKYYSPDVILGESAHVENCPAYGFSSYCAEGDAYVHSKYCAYDMWPRESEYTFGSDFVFSSKFCLKCYNSVNLTRCFEVSHSTACTDCYFCHNVENCHDSMFCFNAKSMHYAIGNVEVGKDMYMRIKKIVLDDLAGRLEKEKKLELNIFNVGCIREKN